MRALEFSEAYYRHLVSDYGERRAILSRALANAGFRISEAEGAYYILAEIDGFGATDDVEFCQWLVRTIGVAAVPGSSFYHHPEMGRGWIRFAFCKRAETLHAAAERLSRIRAHR